MRFSIRGSHRMRRLPVVLMTYTNLVLARTPEGFADSLAAARIARRLRAEGGTSR